MKIGGLLPLFFQSSSCSHRIFFRDKADAEDRIRNRRNKRSFGPEVSRWIQRRNLNYRVLRDSEILSVKVSQRDEKESKFAAQNKLTAYERKHHACTINGAITLLRLDFRLFTASLRLRIVEVNREGMQKLNSTCSKNCIKNDQGERSLMRQKRHLSMFYCALGTSAETGSGTFYEWTSDEHSVKYC